MTDTNIANLTREQKEQLFKLLEQKALVKKERVLDEFKAHAGQVQFLQSPATIRAMFSGNGFGKTTALAIDLIWAHTRKHPYRDTGDVGHSWLLVPSLDKAEDYWAEVKRWCPPSMLPKPSKMGSSNIRRFEWQNGTITTIYSHEQDSDKLEGTNLDALYCDEPPPRDLWIAAFRGLRNNPNYYVVMAGTPLAAAWLYEELYIPWMTKADKKIEIIQGSTYDNPHLSAEFVNDFASRLSEDEKKTRLYGEFSFLQGRVFKDFSRRTHVFKQQDWPTDWPVYCAIDPHPRKPHTVVYLGVTADDVMVVIDELSVEGDIEHLADAMKELEKRKAYKVVTRRVDNSGAGTDWNRDSFIDQLAKFGIRTNPMRKAEKDVAASIQKIQRLFKNNQLAVLENCHNTIKDLELFQWENHLHPEKSGIKEAPKKIHDDFIDPLRYIVMSNPVHSPSLSFISSIGDKTPYNKRPTPAVRPRAW